MGILYVRMKGSEFKRKKVIRSDYQHPSLNNCHHWCENNHITWIIINVYLSASRYHTFSLKTAASSQKKNLELHHKSNKHILMWETARTKAKMSQLESCSLKCLPFFSPPPCLLSELPMVAGGCKNCSAPRKPTCAVFLLFLF